VNVTNAKGWADGLGALLGLSVAILAVILAVKPPQRRTRKILEVIIAALGLMLAFYGYYLSPLLADKLSSLRESETKAAMTQLRAQQADREIAPEQRMRMLALLKSAPKKKVWVTAPEGDQEAKRYARQINDVFVTAGLESDWGGMLAVTYPKGLHIFSSEPSNREAADAIRRALAEAGQPCSDAESNVLNDNSFISVIVGSK
jgi:hypothetical protein